MHPHIKHITDSAWWLPCPTMGQKLKRANPHVVFFPFICRHAFFFVLLGTQTNGPVSYRNTRYYMVCRVGTVVSTSETILSMYFLVSGPY